jgi:hypothetical protein
MKPVKVTHNGEIISFRQSLGLCFISETQHISIKLGIDNVVENNLSHCSYTTPVVRNAQIKLSQYSING